MRPVLQKTIVLLCVFLMLSMTAAPLGAFRNSGTLKTPKALTPRSGPVMYLPIWEPGDRWTYIENRTGWAKYKTLGYSFWSGVGMVGCYVWNKPTDRNASDTYNLTSVSKDYRMAVDHNMWENGTWACVIFSSGDPLYHIGDVLTSGKYKKTEFNDTNSTYETSALGLTGSKTNFTVTTQWSGGMNQKMVESGNITENLNRPLAEWKPTWAKDPLKVGDTWKDNSTRRTWTNDSAKLTGDIVMDFSMSLETNNTANLTYNCTQVSPRTVNGTYYPEAFRIILNGTNTWNSTDSYHNKMSGKTKVNNSEKWIAKEAGWAVEINKTIILKNTTYRLDRIKLLPLKDNSTALEDTEYKAHYWSKNSPVSNWTFETNAPWLTWNSTTQNISGRPTNADVGTCWARINVTGAYNYSDEHNFTIKVNNTPPKILTNDITDTNEDAEYRITYLSSDDGEGTITWHLDTDASEWLSIDQGTGVLSGTPTNDEVGSYHVNVGVDDGNGGWDWSNFTLKVANTNDPPKVVGTPNATAYEDQAYLCVLQAVDVDITDTVFKWYLSTDAPWLSIDMATGKVTGVPENDDVGTHRVNVTVKDPAGAKGYLNYTLTVMNTNDPPTIMGEPVRTAYEDAAYICDLNVTDIDVSDAVFLWTMKTNAGWLHLDGASGLLTGTPSNDNVGAYWVNVTVKDPAGAPDDLNFTLTVVNTNDPPTIVGVPKKTAYEDAAYVCDFNVTDIDKSDHVFLWSMKTNASWLYLGNAFELLEGTPRNDDVGTYWVNITVQDNAKAEDHLNFTLTVINTNDPPTIVGEPKQLAYEDAGYTCDFNVTDIDVSDHVFLWAMKTNAAWLHLDGATGTLTGTPSNDDVGTYWVNVTVKDPAGASDHRNFTLEVRNVNDAPVWANVPSKASIKFGGRFIFDVNATDVDVGDVLTYSIASVPASSISIDPATGIIDWVPKKAGTYTVNISCKDKTVPIYHVFTITVEKKGGQDNPISFISLFLLLLVVVVIAIVVALLVLARRRKGGKAATANVEMVSTSPKPTKKVEEDGSENRGDKEVGDDAGPSNDKHKGPANKEAVKELTQEVRSPVTAVTKVEEGPEVKEKPRSGAWEKKQPDPLDEILMMETPVKKPTKTSNADVKMKCPSCGEPFEPEFLMCPSCGYEKKE